LQIWVWKFTEKRRNLKTVMQDRNIRFCGTIAASHARLQYLNSAAVPDAALAMKKLMVRSC
jgi:hypothetical protein